MTLLRIAIPRNTNRNFSFSNIKPQFTSHFNYCKPSTTPQNTSKMNDPFGNIGQSESYALHRPQYPQPLLNHLSSSLSKLNNNSILCLDIACGSGQLTYALATNDSFNIKKILAIDISDKQLEQANKYSKHEKIEYVLDTKENSFLYNSKNIDSHSLGLITIAQGLHWFQSENKVSKLHERISEMLENESGIYSIIGYGKYTFDEEKYPIFCNAFNTYYYEILKSHHPFESYWEIDRKLLDNAFQSMIEEFLQAFDPVLDESLDGESYRKMFIEQKCCTKEQLFGYFKSWSGYYSYCDRHRNDVEFVDPLEILSKAFDDDVVYNNEDIESAIIDIQIPFFIILLKKK